MSLSTFDLLKQASSLSGAVELDGPQLEGLKRALLEILDDVTSFCDDNGMTYMLVGGTCLGAIRHKGFIPWDDDIDLSMPRESYDRFMERFPKERGDKYFVCDPRTTENYGLAIAHVRLRGTVDRGHSDLGLPREQCGIFIDIFVLENVPDNPLLRCCHGLVSLALGLAASCSRFARLREGYTRLAGTNAQARRVFRAKATIGRLLSFKPLEGWARAWDTWNSLCTDGRSKSMTIPGGRNHYFKEMLPREAFLPVGAVEFEGRRLSAPADPDAYLTALYGPDYMTPPPESAKEAHVVMEFDLGEYGGASEQHGAAGEESA